MSLGNLEQTISDCLKSDDYEWALRLWFILSYAYYCLDETIAPDDSYDALCKMLLRGWKSGWRPKKNHGYIDEECLTSGSAYHIMPSKYPGVARSSAEHYARLLRNRLKYHPYYPDYEDGYCVLLKEHGGTYERKSVGLDRFFE